MRRLGSHSRSLLLIAVLVVLAAMPAIAGDITAYEKRAFLDAQSAGKSIVVFVSADWCPICRKQRPSVDALAGDQKFAGVVVFVVSYDADKETLRELNVRKQSTLIAFKGKDERTRFTAETNYQSIRALFQSSL